MGNLREAPLRPYRRVGVVPLSAKARVTSTLLYGMLHLKDIPSNRIDSKARKAAEQ